MLSVEGELVKSFGNCAGVVGVCAEGVLWAEVIVAVCGEVEGWVGGRDELGCFEEEEEEREGIGVGDAYSSKSERPMEK